jgi:hypothetical protein
MCKYNLNLPLAYEYWKSQENGTWYFFNEDKWTVSSNDTCILIPMGNIV